MDIYALATAHIQPSSMDADLVRHYVDAAMGMIEAATGTVLVDVERGREVFVAPDHAGVRKAQGGGYTWDYYRLRLPLTLPADAEVEVYMVAADGKRHLVARTVPMGQEIPFKATMFCCPTRDVTHLVVRIPPLRSDSWRPNVRQAVLQVAKWLYEHRGDTVDMEPGNILTASGAAGLLAGATVGAD